MNYKNSMVVALVALSLFGCASDHEKILNISSSASGKKIVSVGEKRSVGYDSYYDATAEDGTKYSCSYTGSLAGFGFVENQKCAKK